MRPVQILGTVFILVGIVATVGGILWVLRTTAGRLTQWTGDAIDLWTQLLSTINRTPPPPPPPAGQAESDYGFHGEGQASGTAAGFPIGTTPAEIYLAVQEKLTTPLLNELTAQRSELTTLRNHIDKQADDLRNEINEAISAERERGAAVRTRDFSPTLIGLAFTFVGTLCQLFG